MLFAKLPAILFVAGLLMTAWPVSADGAETTLIEPETAIERGLAAIREEDFDRAATIFEQAVLANPQNSGLQRHLGIAYYKSGRNEQAIAQLEQIIELASEDAETRYALGVICLARASEVGVLKIRKILNESIRQLEQAIALDPAHTGAHYYLIQVLINAPKVMGGNQERAEALNERLAELSPIHHRVVNSNLAAQREEYETAEQLLVEAHRSQPRSTAVNFALLSHYHDREQYEKAVSYGQTFLELPKTWDDTALSSAHYLLAQAYAELGDLQQSRHHYALTLTHTQNEKLIARVEKEVAELEKDRFRPQADS